MAFSLAYPVYNPIIDAQTAINITGTAPDASAIVEKTAQEPGYEFDGLNRSQSDRGYYSLTCSQFIIPLVKEQQLKIEKLQKENAAARTLKMQVQKQQAETARVAPMAERQATGCSGKAGTAPWARHRSSG